MTRYALKPRSPQHLIGKQGKYELVSNEDITQGRDHPIILIPKNNCDPELIINNFR